MIANEGSHNKEWLVYLGGNPVLPEGAPRLPSGKPAFPLELNIDTTGVFSAMNDDRLRRILLNQLKRFREAPPYPCLYAAPDERDFRVWYFLIKGLDSPVAGEYIFKLTAPDCFPHLPPRFEFLTPNGTYEPGGPVCISIGEFHSGDKPGREGSYGWRPALGMGGFAVQVVNGLICHEMLDPDSIRIIQTTAEEKAALALASHAYNRRVWPAVCAALAESARDVPPAPSAVHASPAACATRATKAPLNVPDPEMSAYIDELLK